MSEPGLTSKMIRFAVVLMLICGGAALGVGGVYVITRERIEIRKAEEVEAAKSTVFPGQKPQFEAIDKALSIVPEYDESRKLKGYRKASGSEMPSDIVELDRVYIAKADGKEIGYAAMGVGQGYKSRLQVIVGAAPSKEGGLKIAGLFLLDAGFEETPGLGTKVKEKASTRTIWSLLRGGEAKTSQGEEIPKFWQQFTGKAYEQLVLVKTADPEKITGITGATISSRGMTEAVKDAMNKIRMVHNLTNKVKSATGGDAQSGVK
ncbi:MAG TPA: FMN-binding protein [Candidatus Brocadiia bacterium]|nr:FMN-binding protein [Candidatus Brocadiia bacterium]